ncbi:NAD(P)H-dependent oxidoreductase [Candidatus Fermentibacterales bacterium]|nr:NAD(P)H-dependent oxidoreductase [Candidatus Fermentibacterales bacterium]
MKVSTILGSPHVDGNTGTVLGRFEGMLEDSGHEFDRINIIDHEVMGCMGCYTCRDTPDAPGCIQVDDGNAIFERLIAADAVVYATPLYCWGFSAQLKALIDRHICLKTGDQADGRTSLMEGKPVLLLVTSAGPEEENADVIQTSFERLCRFLALDCHGKFVVARCVDPGCASERAGEFAARMLEALAP